MPLVGARATASRGYFGGGTKPGAPIITSSTQGVSSLSIAFTAPVFNGGLLISRYEYAVSINNSTWTTFATATSGTNPPTSPVTISGLTNGQPYYVKIRAVNGLGFGPESNVWSTTTTPRTTPDAPTLNSVTRGYRQLTANFSAPAFNGGSDITDYEYSTNGGSTWASMGQTTTANYAITGLADFTEYNVRVRAANVAGGGAHSSTVAQYTAGLPGTVTGVSATSNANTQSVVSWTAPDANGTPITDYVIQYSTSSTFASSITTFSHTASSAISITVTGLSNGSTYYFRVKAVNAVGESAGWSVISAGAVPATAPSAPVIGTSTTSDRSVTINWTASTSTGGAAVEYTVELWNSVDGWGAASPKQSGTSKTYVARNDRGYIARVTASNSAGTSAVSSNSTQVYPAMVIPTMNWEDTSATRYSSWRVYWSGTNGYTYQPQTYVSSWGDEGTSRSGSGTHYSDYWSASYHPETKFVRVKVTDPDSVVSYTAQKYVTNGRPANTVVETAAYTAWDDATLYSSSGSTNYRLAANGAYGGETGPTSPYPEVISSSLFAFRAVKIRMARINTGSYDLTGVARKVFLYGPGGMQMALYKGSSTGQTWGTGVASTTRWTGTTPVEYTWYVDTDTSGYTSLFGTQVIIEPDDLFIQPYSDANPTTNYSTEWSNTEGTTVTITVYFYKKVSYATTYKAQVNSVYG
jgi:hypothetical protein